jgi:hypothetical protein
MAVQRPAQVGRQPQDVQALGRFELFYVSAVTTVVVVRTLLAATGYPRVGGGNLHVAHVLWGGLLMGTAIVILEIFPGSRTKRRAAVVGGIGFGLFIDEVGKFVTKNVNYFFKPAIAMIYIVFVVLFLLVREVVLQRPMSDARRLAVATEAVADLALGQLHEDARQRALELVAGIDDHPDLLGAIVGGLQAAHPVGDGHVEVRITRMRNRLGEAVRDHIDEDAFSRLLGTMMVVGIGGVLGELALIVIGPGSGGIEHFRAIDYASVGSIACSVPLTCYGLYRLVHGDRAGALRIMFRATLITILLTQVFVFFRYQLSGVIGLAFALAVLATLRVLAESATAAYGPSVRGRSGPARSSPVLSSRPVRGEVAPAG